MSGREEFLPLIVHREANWHIMLEQIVNFVKIYSHIDKGDTNVERLCLEKVAYL
jgi:hypothetical protein